MIIFYIILKLNPLYAGVHSTQRSESTHSAVKKKITASTLMVQCCKKLVDYSSSVETRSAVDVARKVIGAASKNIHSEMPCITNMTDKLSLHAMELLKGQQAQVLGYSADHIPIQAGAQQQQQTGSSTEAAAGAESSTQNQQQQTGSSTEAAAGAESSTQNQQQQTGSRQAAAAGAESSTQNQQQTGSTGTAAAATENCLGAK